MSVQPRKLKNNKVVYWVTFDWQGKTQWVRSGTNERQAHVLENELKQQVKDGTYTPGLRGRFQVRTWFSYFWTVRHNRAKQGDMDYIDAHVLSVEWFARMPLADVKPLHILKLVEEMRRSVDAKGNRRLGEKTIAIIYGVLKQAMKRAVFEEKIAADPCVLPKGTIKWKSPKSSRRKPYPRAAAHALIHDPRIPLESRVFNAIAFYTGMRKGEVSGRRWRDWLRDAVPLSALHCHTQYNDQPLKTDDEEYARPRMIPVHPDLEPILRDWWASGFELVHRRKPTLDDFIIPTKDGEAHTRSSAYKMFRRALARVNVPNQTLHATRNTFISITRSNGAPKDVIETITHNAAGDMIDTYTEFEWRPICAAMARFDLDLDQDAATAVFAAPAPGLEHGGLDGNDAKSNVTGRSQRRSQRSGKTGEDPLPDAWFDANQRRLLKFAEVDPEAARPGLAFCSAISAVRHGDLDQARDALRLTTEAMGLDGGPLRLVEPDPEPEEPEPPPPKAEAPTLTCLLCETEFQRTSNWERTNRAQGKAGPFCSRSCAGRWARQQQMARGDVNTWAKRKGGGK